ncbi:MAG: ATP synthase F1 subunit epsilon [Myxococcota bacterium]|nr:ATP synthase F1 subunit epsilon [Myxococcota bacterium]
MALDLVIVTPEGEAFSGLVKQVVLPGSEGQFGVLEQHERVLAPLQHGVVEIKTDGGSQWAAVSNGFADVAGERVVVLADACTLAADIDQSGVEEAKSEAESELASLGDGEEHDARRETLTEIVRQSEVQLEVLSK